ncbi:p21-carboxy-terminal region-binding protein [Cystoisospora suis]|uniref:p21-carboxy-terminal region-binding protein n=1 Tax=Cystoisospora suis TaxID=483139 RepID=A0A2C6KT59_9APIC|nr:p21-carboxy-terminal region-binding protein [Cystoisospora suis]
MADGKIEARGGQKKDELATVSNGEAPDFVRARERPERCKRQGPTQEREESSDDDDGDEIELRAKTKQQIRTQADSSSDDDGDDDSDDVDQTVQASFGIFDPHEEAQDAILLLLRQSRLDAHLKVPGSALRSLAEAVANQGNVGSVLKAVEDEEDRAVEQKQNAGGDHGGEGEDGGDSSVVGFFSLLSLQQYPEVTDVFRDAVLQAASQHAPADQKAKLDEVLCPPVQLRVKGDGRASNSGSTSKVSTKGKPVNCGWLLKERLSNTPPQLVPRMFSSLLEDIEWSMTTEEMDEEERPFYAYTHVMTLCRVYKDAEATCNASTQCSKKTKTTASLGFKPYFLHPEDEELLESATVFFSWPTGSSVRVSVVHDEEATTAGGQLRKRGKPSGVTPPCQIRSCPEYLLFLLLPFDKLRKCTEAVAERANMQLAD